MLTFFGDLIYFLLRRGDLAVPTSAYWFCRCTLHFAVRIRIPESQKRDIICSMGGQPLRLMVTNAGKRRLLDPGPDVCYQS